MSSASKTGEHNEAHLRHSNIDTFLPNRPCIHHCHHHPCSAGVVVWMVAPLADTLGKLGCSQNSHINGVRWGLRLVASLGILGLATVSSLVRLLRLLRVITPLSLRWTWWVKVSKDER